MLDGNTVAETVVDWQEAELEAISWAIAMAADWYQQVRTDVARRRVEALRRVRERLKLLVEEVRDRQQLALPPEATPEVLRGVAAELRRLEARAERWAENLAENGGTPTYCRAEAAVYRALAELVERETAKRERRRAALREVRRISAELGLYDEHLEDSQAVQGQREEGCDE